MIKRVVDAAILRTCHAVHEEANDIVQRTMTDFVLASGPKIVIATLGMCKHTTLVIMTQKATTTLLQRFDSCSSLEELQGALTQRSIVEYVLAQVNSPAAYGILWDAWSESEYTKAELSKIASFGQQAIRFLSRCMEQGGELRIEVTLNIHMFNSFVYEHTRSLDYLNRDFSKGMGSP
jgi:hypothetical protein